MQNKTSIQFQLTGLKIPAIKALRVASGGGTVGMGLIEAKDAIDAGVITVDSRYAHAVVRALKEYGKICGVVEDPTDFSVAATRLLDLSRRMAARALNTVCSVLEGIEDTVWG